MYIFTDCIFRTDHISLYKLDLSYDKSLLYVSYCHFLILYYACCYLMTSSISTLVDLWNTE